jgi:signal transduction histidine kinase/serine/threonine protein kinase
MLSLPGYQIIELISTGILTANYQGLDEQQKKPVIIKVPISESPNQAEITALDREYAILQIFERQGILKLTAIEQEGSRLALILEDCGDLRLRQLIQLQSISWSAFLPLAIALTDTVERLHQIPIIHNNINPDLIAIETKTGAVKIFDYSIATNLSQAGSRDGAHYSKPASPSAPQQGAESRGNPLWLPRSREQEVDYGKDLYALGVTFYEMLTGLFPVENNISIALNELTQKIPPVIVAIVKKLLATDAIDRYQTAAALKVDLEICLLQLTTLDRTQIISSEIGKQLVDNLCDYTIFNLPSDRQKITGFITIGIYDFYHSLALLSEYQNVEPQQKNEYLRTIANNQEQMQKWVEFCPAHFQHKYDLVAAEQARILQQNWQALELYDKAIRGAKERGYLQEEALANELAAEFYLASSKEKIAQNYLIDAYRAYQCWGAIAKVQSLEAKYSSLLSTQLPINYYNLSQKTEHLDRDFLLLIQSSQAISQELDLDRLLAKIIETLLEITQISKGFIILSKQKQLFVEIAASTVQGKMVTLRQSIPVNITTQISKSIVDFVVKKGEPVLVTPAIERYRSLINLDDKHKDNSSIMCLPIINKTKFIGIIYLEKLSASASFTNEQIEIVNHLCNQAAISLENSMIYQKLSQSKAIEKAAQQIRLALEKEKEVKEMKSHFLCMTSHEFRTPLTTILSSTELLKHYSQTWNSEKKQFHFAKIQASIAKITNLLDDILLINQIESENISLNSVSIDLVAICRELVQEINLKLDPTKHQIIFTCPERILQASVDGKLIQYIISNLLSNAVKFSPDGGRIEFNLNTREKTIILRVQDWGIGIPKDEHKKLFNLFYRAKNVGKISGTGLGLATVKKFVDLHGGKIYLESEVGIGTIFTIEIPTNPEGFSSSTFPKYWTDTAKIVH